MSQAAKLLLLSLSILLLSAPAFCQDDEDVPEEPMCDAASLKGAVIAYVDYLYSGDNGEDDSDEEMPVDPEQADEDIDSPSYDKLEEALSDMSKAKIFFSKNPGVILGSLSRSSAQDLKDLDRLDFSDEESFSDDDLIEKLYNGENCGDLEKILSGYKTSKLKRLNSKKQVADLIKSAGIMNELIDGLSDADLIDSETSIELTALVNKAISTAKAVQKKARR